MAQPAHGALLREYIRDERVSPAAVQQCILPETLRNVAQHAPDIPDWLARGRVDSPAIWAGGDFSLIEYSAAFSAYHNAHLACVSLILVLYHKSLSLSIGIRTA